MCGIIGMINSNSASFDAYQGLVLMQHRGQDAAGIVSFDHLEKRFHIHKDHGLVDSVFNKEILLNLKGKSALGHTRYSTIGFSSNKDNQPLMLNYPFGISLVHNGNIVNTNELKSYLSDKNRYIYSQNDAEILLNLLADGLLNYSLNTKEFQIETLKRSIKSLMDKAKGGYAVIAQIAEIGTVAFRDPNGIRPLILGKKNESYCFASESNALNFLEYDSHIDVQPGQMIFIDNENKVHSFNLNNKIKKSCVFEYIYFANPESTIDGSSVYTSREKLGYYLGKKIQTFIDNKEISPDIIVPIPETSRISALNLSTTLEVPFKEILIKNRYIQRSFILNSNQSRKNAVRYKLSPVSHEFKDKNVLLVDDSIVRGTTSKHIVEMIKQAGAKNVYFASTCPPIKNPCFYGIDFPLKEELVAFNKTIKEVEKELNADRIFYLNQEDLHPSINSEDLCMACLDGEYPVEIDSANSFINNRIKDKPDQNRDSTYVH